MKRTILVICALGYATSTMIKKNIEEFLEANGIKDWSVEAIGYQMSENYVKDASIIVSSLDLNKDDYNVPVINGVPLISGINAEDTLQEILAEIKKYQ